MEVVKVTKESFPDVKLVGKRYTNEDRDASGTFAAYWQQSFGEGWFDTLGKCKGIDSISQDYVGAMRMVGENGGFEYWIGLLLAPDAQVPHGFEAAQIPAGEVGVCWLYGNDKSGELYSMEASDMSMGAMMAQGWKIDESAWFFERYNCPRFTQPDEKGNVILDICAYLA